MRYIQIERPFCFSNSFDDYYVTTDLNALVRNSNMIAVGIGRYIVNDEDKTVTGDMAEFPAFSLDKVLLDDLFDKRIAISISQAEFYGEE